MIGDEVAFHTNGRVNNHNVRQYSLRNNTSNCNFDVGMSREKVSAWMRMCGNGSFVGPVFYENSMIGDRYLNLITERIIPELREIYQNRFKYFYLKIGIKLNFYYYLLPDVHGMYPFEICFSISTSSHKHFFVIFLICR